MMQLDEQRRIVAYMDGLQAKVNALREWVPIRKVCYSTISPRNKEKT